MQERLWPGAGQAVPQLFFQTGVCACDENSEILASVRIHAFSVLLRYHEAARHKTAYAVSPVKIFGEAARSPLAKV